MALLTSYLLHRIIAQGALHYLFNPVQRCFKKDLGTLRSLRLANRELCHVASQYLFEELTLYFTEASHVKMMAIAQHPTYRAYPRLLCISSKPICGPYLYRDAFRQWFRGYCFIPQHMSYLRGKKSGAIDFHHGAYTSMYNDQERLLPKAGDFLKTAIGCFPRLERVGSSVRPPRSAYSVPSTDDAFISDFWQDSAYLLKFDLDHAAMIVTAVSRGRSLAATHIEVGDLFCEMDTMVLDLPDPVASWQIRSLVADTKTINLTIQTSDYTGLRQLLNTSRLQRLLGQVKNLESLACSNVRIQGVSFPQPHMWNILGDNKWPHLRQLGLCGFYVSAIELRKLFHRHRSTLQKLTLQHILLSRGIWHDVFDELRQGVLRTVEIHNLGCGCNPNTFFLPFFETPLEPLPYSHWLHAFLFRGAPWAPRVEDPL